MFETLVLGPYFLGLDIMNQGHSHTFKLIDKLRKSICTSFILYMVWSLVFPVFLDMVDHKRPFFLQKELFFPHFYY